MSLAAWSMDTAKSDLETKGGHNTPHMKGLLFKFIFFQF
jgi:hypothetical protein